MRVRVWVAIGLAAGLAAAAGCDGRREHLIAGRTMGTTYHVTVVTGPFGAVAGLKEKIDRRLDEVNRSMSPYLADSEISRFNRLAEAGREFPVSEDFHTVMRVAAQIHALSQGAWDGTLNPLVDLWGFGRAGRGGRIPDPERIREALAAVGFEKLEIRGNRTLVKRDPRVTLDLSSIAKGFGVDAVAALLRQAGFVDFLVEIGGEVAAEGRRPDRRRWRIGINLPRPDAPADAVFRVAAVSGRALATSGDYRSFFVQDGVRYAHILDPRTGRPAANRVASVSILADTCTLADGLATAVMVMGPEAGLALIERLEGVEGLIVVEAPDGSLREHASGGWHRETSAAD
jgi:thiamine biosynthesis lipoprotein